MFDNNCSLHALAEIYKILNRTGMTTDGVSNITGAMEGPAHSLATISDMFRKLGISDGTYTAFDSMGQAEAFMSMREIGTPFGFCYEQRNSSVGHMIVAVKGMAGILYRDPQLHETKGPYVPIEIPSSQIPNGCNYYVFRPGIVLP